VVTTITGITHCDDRSRGGEPRGRDGDGDRTDARAAASEFVLDVEAAAIEVVDRSSDSAVGTVGSLSVSPNATNVVPGRVEAGVDVRDVETESMETIVTSARESLARLERERGVETAFERPFDVAPTPMSDRFRDAARARPTGGTDSDRPPLRGRPRRDAGRGSHRLAHCCSRPSRWDLAQSARVDGLERLRRGDGGSRGGALARVTGE